MDKKNHIETSKSGFKVPKDYFDTLEDSVFSRLESESFTEKSGFKIPENYFSSFEVETPSSKTKAPAKVIRLDLWSKWVAAASIVAIAVLGAIHIDSISPEKNIQFSDLDNDMIEEYLDYNMESPEDFIDYETTDLKNLVDKNIITLNNHDIMEYLNDKLDDQDLEND